MTRWSSRPARVGCVLDSAAVGAGAPLGDPHSLEPPEPLDEKRPGDAGKPTVQVVEVPEAREELSDDQRGPAVSENLRRSGHRAVLAVQVHGAHLPGDAGVLGSVIVLAFPRSERQARR